MASVERYAGLSVAAALRNRATSDPESTFLIAERDRLTFGQVESRAEALAASFHTLGIEPGDRVAIALPGWAEFVVSTFAVAKVGGVIVPLDPELAVSDLKYLLRHSEAVAAVCPETWKGRDYLQLFEELLLQLPELQYLVTVGEEDLWYDDRVFQFEDLLSAGEGRDYPVPEIDPAGDLFAILYTSGTTGKPKGVELTHENLMYAAAGTVEAIGLAPDDRVVGVTAFSHVFGLGPGIVGSLLAGASLVLQDEVDGDAILDLVERHRVTAHYGTPTLFAAELRALDSGARDLSSLRVGLMAGAPARRDLILAVEERIVSRLQIAYSMTEAASTVAITRPEDPGEKRHFTVGRPLPGVRLQVYDEDGSLLPVESVGELAVKGPGVMRGYYRQPSATAKAFDEEGFFRSGDLGMVDEEGYVHLVGRRKEVIIRSGFNVYPREVEDRIHAHPAVAEAVAVGVPDEVLGEAICACIVPVEGAIVTGPEIQEWCRITLADQKVPDQVRFLDAFPRTATGKIRRIELSRMVRDGEPGQGA